MCNKPMFSAQWFGQCQYEYAWRLLGIYGVRARRVGKFSKPTFSSGGRKYLKASL
jgi:hypothetical protein